MKESHRRAKYNVGADHPQWKGGRLIDKSGYILIRVDRRKYIREHRLIMEQHLGRKLQNGEVVHHKNGIRDDNRRANLRYFPSKRAHQKFHKSPSFSYSSSPKREEASSAF